MLKSAKVVSINSTGLNVECDAKIEEKYHTKTRTIDDCNKLGKISDTIRKFLRCI